MSKRGQITIFMIIGGIILILFGFMFYTNSYSAKKDTDTSVKKTAELTSGSTLVKSYVENFLEEVSKEGIWLIGLGGGYINPSGSTTTFQGKSLPYYLDGTTKNNPPPIADMETGLSNYISNKFILYFNKDLFEDIGINVEPTSTAVVEVDINSEDVTVKMEYPLVIKTLDTETILKDFRINLPIRLKRVYDAAFGSSSVDGVVTKIKDEWDIDNQYDLSVLNCDYYDGSLQINIYEKDGISNPLDTKVTKIIQIIDFNTFFNNYKESYTFQFAVKRDQIILPCILASPCNLLCTNPYCDPISPMTGGMCAGTPMP